MRVAFTFRNLEPSDGIKNYATEKISKFKKYLQDSFDADVTVSLERHMHRIDVAISAGSERYAGHEESDDMYASIDLVIDKVDKQIRRNRDRISKERQRA